MNITLERSLYSIVWYLTEGVDKEQTMILFDELPEDFTVPAIFFPTPITRSRKTTLQSYRTTMTMRVMYFAPTDWEAYGAVADARDSLIAVGCNVPIVDDDGEKQFGCLRITDVETGKDENGIQYLQFDFPVFFEPAGETAEKIQTFDIRGTAIQSSKARSAWIEATKTLREEQEEKSEWLKTTISRMQL